MSRALPSILLALLLLSSGPAAAESEVELRSRLHRDIGQLQEDLERAQARRDRRTAHRIDREIKGILSELRESRRREREQLATSAADSDPARADIEAVKETSVQPEPAAAPGAARLPYLSQIRQRRFTSPVEPLQPGDSSADPDRWNKVGRLVSPETEVSPPPLPVAPAPVEAAPRGGLLDQMEVEAAKLRATLEQLDRGFAALTPEEQESFRPMHEMARRQAANALAEAEATKQRTLEVLGQ